MFAIALSGHTGAQLCGILRRNITVEAVTFEGFRFLIVISDSKMKTYVRNIGEDVR